jgi:hypothetical protein
MTRKEPVTLDEAVLIFKMKMSDLYKENGTKYEKPISAKEVQDLITAGERILTNLDKCGELKNAEVVHNEYPLFEDIHREDGLSIKFKGFIDLVIKTKAKNGDTVLYVCDFKTCSWGWDTDTRSDRWKHYQIFLYKYFLCKKFDLDPKYVRTAFVLLKKRPPKGTEPVEFFPVSAGPVSVQRAIDMLNTNLTEMKSRIETGEFVKERSSCQDKYGNTCPFYKTDHCT